MEEAASISRKGTSKGFEDERVKTFTEYVEFLGEIGCPSVREASGVDVVAFVQGWWLKRHTGNCRTVVPETGEKIASASAVKAVLGHIAKSYSIMGMSDERNPGKAEAVRSYREGYRVQVREKGVREKRAKVMSQEKVEKLMEHLEEQIRKEKGVRRCVLAMDLAAVAYLWETWARGKECGEVERCQVAEAEEVVRPGWSKTVKEAPSCIIKVAGKNQRGGFLWAAAGLVSEMEKAGCESGKGFLFRPLNKQKTGFDDVALSAGALNRRVQKHMQEAGLHEGETLHSFRRSAVQHAASIEGYDVSRLMERGRWRSKAAFRLYVEEIASEFARGTL